MPRRARLAVAGIPWHIIQRGNNRSACFYTEMDYQYYLEVMAEQACENHCAIHAYVLMTNHVHLLLTPRDKDSASKMMKHLGQRYVQYINRTYRRSGTLWEGRFRSCLAQDETYLLTCQRYIELNPVRAKMVEDPGDYEWSSYRANAHGLNDVFLTAHPNYLKLGTNDETRYRQYRYLFDEQLSEKVIDSIRFATNGNYVLGNKRFEDEIKEMLGRRVIAGKAGRRKSVI